MKLLIRLVTRLTGLTVAFTVLLASATTVTEHFGHRNAPAFTHSVTHLIDSGLSLLPDSAEESAKNMLTALQDAVSGITENIISRLTP